MKTIWKGLLEPTSRQEIEVPVGAEFLCAREQHDRVCVWYRCDPDNVREKRKIAIIGTGHNAPEDGHYLGTASLHGGALILHVFAWPQ